jgi:hypothetical protein
VIITLNRTGRVRMPDLTSDKAYYARCMATTPAELSSISAALDDLSKRIGDIADRMEKEGRNDISYELFEVERSLTPPQRRLARLISR